MGFSQSPYGWTGTGFLCVVRVEVCINDFVIAVGARTLCPPRHL